MSDFYSNFNQQQNFQQSNYYNNDNTVRSYGLSGEQEYVMTIKDYFKVWLFTMIPFYNFYFIIRVLIGPTSRTNKTFTNIMRMGLIMGLILCLITIPLASSYTNNVYTDVDVSNSYAGTDLDYIIEGENNFSTKTLSSNDKLILQFDE